METGKSLLLQFKKRWQLLVLLEAALYALGIAVLTYFVLNSLYLGLLLGLLAFLLLVGFKNPWKINLKRTSNYIDAHLEEASFSTGLLLEPQENLSNLSKLQQYRVTTELRTRLKSLTPPNQLKRTIGITLGLIVLGVAIHALGFFKDGNSILKVTTSPDTIQFIPTDSISSKTVVPKLQEQEILISYPAYTRQPAKVTADPNIKSVINANLRWRLQFDAPVSQVSMEKMGEILPLKKVGDAFEISLSLEASGFYSFRFSNEEGVAFTSDMFSLEAIPDAPPEIEIVGLPQYTYFDFSDIKRVPLKSSITDDFGIAKAHIIATVSKGSGESVKFREEQLDFKESIPKGIRQINVSKVLDLNALKMEVGDELYFYVEAFDEKEPKPNVTRSETYFAVIKDTITDQFAVEGTLGVDQMPDYFRSQRQLIIDTEKLIKDKPKITEKEFKSRSNELGFDQKALRLKYGQFMGDESEMGIAPGEAIEAVSVEESSEHAEGEEKDLLKDYSHDHDGDNEHNLVATETSEEEKDPLHDYLHNHDDPEESTLFEESLKTKLRKALTIMWDAELHLRLYAPEKSLTFQKDALLLIQEIKNSARIYVHRIGFDPPPIKEESRLTGSIKEVNNFKKQEDLQRETPFAAIKNAVVRLEGLIHQNTRFTEGDERVFYNAGTELATLAIENPGKYLQVLQGLKRIQNNTGRTQEIYRTVQRGLLSVLPQTEQTPGLRNDNTDEINALFLKQLETYD